MSPKLHQMSGGILGVESLNVHGRCLMVRHAFVTLLGCRRTPRHAGFAYVQTLNVLQRLSKKVCKTFKDRDYMQTLSNRSLR